MSMLHWVADGIEVAERAGGVTLERRRGCGFDAKVGIGRRHDAGTYAGFDIPDQYDPEDYEDRAQTGTGRARDRTLRA